MKNEPLTSLPFRPNVGRPLKCTPEELLEKFKEYVQWCQDNPILTKVRLDARSVEGIAYGNTTTEEKPRMISVSGFCIFIGVTLRWWGELENGKRKKEFSAVKDLIREFCEDYQKEMAANHIFNANIISRLLGLADKKQVEATTPISLTLASPKAMEGLKGAIATGAEPRKPQDEE